MPTIDELIDQHQAGGLQEEVQARQESLDNTRGLSIDEMLNRRYGSPAMTNVEAGSRGSRTGFEATVGSFGYGAAETGELVSRWIDRSVVSSEALRNTADSLSKWRKKNPQYSPPEVRDSWDLITSPTALTSRIFGGAAYTALQVGLAALPKVGWAAAASLAYGVESQRAYESAVQFGATEDEATRAGRMTGVVNAGIQLMTDLKILHIARGEQSALARRAARSGIDLLKAAAPTIGTIEDAARIGLLSSLQGATNEGIALFTYGREIDPGFMDRRIQETIGAAATAGLFGLGGRTVRKVLGMDGTTGEPTKDAEIRVWDRTSAVQFLMDERGMTPDQAASSSAIMDSMATQWSNKNGRAKAEWYGGLVNELRDAKTNTKNIHSDLDAMAKIWEDRSPMGAVKRFADFAVRSMPEGPDKQLFISSFGEKGPSDAFSRYLWDGKAPSPELVDSFEEIRGQMRDIYRSTKEVGKRISPEVRAAFDRLLSLDTDQINAVRDRIKGYQEVLKTLPKPKASPQKIEELKKQIALVTKEPQVPEPQRYFDPDTETWVEEPGYVPPKAPPETTKTEVNPNIPDWVNEKMIEAGKNPNRLVNEIDALRPQYTEQVKSDPIYKWAVENDTTLAEKMLKGEVTKEEYLAGISSSKKETTEPTSEQSPYKTYTDLKSLIGHAYGELRTLQLGRLLPPEMSPVARRSRPEGYEREVLRHETDLQSRQRSGLARAWTGVQRLWDMAAPLRPFAWGRKLLDLTGDVVSFTRTQQGSWERDLVRGYLDLTNGDRHWLQKEQGNGFLNVQRLLDVAGVPQDMIIINPPSEGLKNFRDLAYRINYEFGKMAERNGMTIKLNDGTRVAYQQPLLQRMLRFLTDDVRKEVRRGSGPIYEAIIKEAAKWNPDLAKKGMQSVKDAISTYFVDPELKRNSPLETARQLPIMPAVIKVGSETLQIFKTEPLHYLRQSVRVQAQRIGWAKVFADYGLESAKTNQLRQITKELGVTPEWNDAILRGRLQEKLGGEQSELYGSRKDLFRLAKDVGEPRGPTRQDYIDALDKVTLDSLTDKRRSTLTKIARRLGGVDLKATDAILLGQIKERIREEPMDFLDVAVKNFKREGGDERAAMDVLALSQGIPIHELSRNLFTRTTKLVSNLIGSAQTSLQALINIPQTLIQVPRMTGLTNYMGAMSKVLNDYRLTRAHLVAMGAIPDTHHSWGIERGYFLEGLGRNIRQMVGTVTGANLIADFNNVVAGESFSRMVESWKTHGMEAGDVATAKELGLQPFEIDLVKKGQVPDFIRNKIVQNGVAASQFVTESAHRRGYVENNPLTSMLFAYSSYAQGTARAMGGFLRETVVPAAREIRNLATGKAFDKNVIATFAYRTGLLLAGSVGAGVLSQILKDTVKGDPNKRLDDSMMDRFTGAIFEVQLLGPFQRFIDSANYDGGRGDAFIVGMMPQVRAIQEVYHIVRNALTDNPVHGKYAKFGIGSQIWEAAKQNTPLVKAVTRWWDRVENPDLSGYEEAKTATARYEKEVKKEGGNVGDTHLNPHYYKVWQAVSRNNPEATMEAAQEYYESYVKEVVKDPTEAEMKEASMEKAVQGLRNSLLQRSPVNLGGPFMADFLNRLPEDRRQAYLKSQMKYVRLVDVVAPK